MAAVETTASRPSTEEESLQVAEASRETEWKDASFMRELFLGKLRLELLTTLPLGQRSRRAEFVQFYDSLKSFLAESVDPVAIDDSGEYPEHVVEELKKLGAFGMKIPVEYGGLGFSASEYITIMELVGGYDASLVALLSAHQSIGVPQPVNLFGSADLKHKYLRRCAEGAISAFALTEHDVGSDPARLATTAELTPEGDAYIINGEKLWCTNGTLAELLVVMASDPKTEKISAFVVETDWEGVTIEHRCRFMGLKALGNAVIRFENVRVPRENLIGKEGRGLKIALVTLNTGRLTLPAGTAGLAKSCLEACREWSAERVQWGRPVGQHEAIAHRLSDMASTAFAMEAVSDLAAKMAERKEFDIRLEAAAAKEWNTVQGWRLVDSAMQIRGGRGYETEKSLRDRGEKPIGIERWMRDCRINLIFEGSSEIMHLFMAREAVDKHLQLNASLINPKAGLGDKIKGLPKSMAFYALWYPKLWLSWSLWPKYRAYGRLGKHLRFVDSRARKLARGIFHGMAFYGPKLQYRQAYLFRVVDIANQLFAMVASILRTQKMLEDKHPDAHKAMDLTAMFCRDSQRIVNEIFGRLWKNDDGQKRRVAKNVLAGEYTFLESMNRVE